ncbi:hypothetical protein LXL04_003247 [Taraxacum kok-saghyz]
MAQWVKTLASPRGGQGFESRRVSIRGGHGLVFGSGFIDSAYYNGQRPGHPGEPLTENDNLRERLGLILQRADEPRESEESESVKSESRILKNQLSDSSENLDFAQDDYSNSQNEKDLQSEHNRNSKTVI